MTVLPFTRLHLPRRLGVAGATAALVGSLLVVGAPTALADPIHTPVLGAGKVQADFNGDGYADLVAGATNPDEEDGDTGMTVIFYGSASGLTTTGRQQINGPELPGVGVNDRFSPSSYVAGDFNGDGYSELVIADSTANVGNVNQAGEVYVIPGSATGLKISSAKAWSQATSGVPGAPEPGDVFGSSIAAADFGGGPQIDLAIGVRGELLGKDKLRPSGMVHVLYGTSRGLSASGDQVWTQDSSGVPGKAEGGDSFGDHLAAGDFDGKNKADLAVGVPFENVGDDEDAGAVTVIYSSSKKLSGKGSQSWTQASGGISGTTEYRDYFGGALAAGNFTGHNRDDLAIGSVGEKFTGRTDVGSVHVLLGSSSGLTATGSQTWSLPGVGAPAGTTDYFGQYLLAADFGHNPAGSKHGDLLIGTFSSENDNPPSPDYLLYGQANGVGSPEAVDESSGAAADFDKDGYADLAVSAGPDLDSAPGDPATYIYDGSAAGLDETGPQVITVGNYDLPSDDWVASGALSAAGSP
jgi:hypothetical protein